MKLHEINKKINSDNRIDFSSQLKVSKSKRSINLNTCAVNAKKIITINDSEKKVSGRANYSAPLKCFDSLGTAYNYEMELGNICIIGKEKEISDLVNHLISCFEEHNHRLSRVSPEEFLRAGRSNNFVERSYLIHINPAQESCTRIETIIGHCRTKFIFCLEGLNLVAPVTLVANNVKYNKIIKSLEGDFVLRKVQIASLNQNEFLTINKIEEKILCLKRRGDNV